MSHFAHQEVRGSARAVAPVSRSLTVTDLCFCLVPIGLFLSIVSLV
ncbi:MAG: hypothetical protein ACKO1M_07355 [Planctomycetota bacterium]